MCAPLVNVVSQQFTHVVRYFCSVFRRFDEAGGMRGVIGGPRVRGNMTHFPGFRRGNLRDPLCGFFPVPFRAENASGKREMEIEKLQKGDANWSTARYVLSVRPILPSLPRRLHFFFLFFCPFLYAPYYLNLVFAPSRVATSSFLPIKI